MAYRAGWLRRRGRGGDQDRSLISRHARLPSALAQRDTNPRHEDIHGDDDHNGDDHDDDGQ